MRNYAKPAFGYHGMSARTFVNLKRELGEGFTREQVLRMGETELRRVPDMGAVGVRDAMNWARGNGEAADRTAGGRDKGSFDHRYAGLPRRIAHSLRWALGEGFTPEMVLAEGNQRLNRVPGLGPVGAREALEWADAAATKTKMQGGGVQLEALIELARSGDEPAEVLAAMVRKAWAMMDAKDRVTFEDAALSAVEASRDGSRRGPGL